MISCPLTRNRSPQFVSEPGEETGLSWDNYSDTPVFQLELEQRKIQLVSTDHSELESLHGSFHVGGGSHQASTQQQEIVTEILDGVFTEESVAVLSTVADNSLGTGGSPKQFNNITMANQIADGLEELRQDILDQMDDLPAADIVAGMETQAEDDRDKIWELKNNFRKQVRSFIVEYSDTVPGLKERWEECLTDLVQKVTNYRKEVTVKVNQLRPTVRMSEFERKTLELQEKALLEKQEKRSHMVKLQMAVGLAEAKAKFTAFQEDYAILSSEIVADSTPYADRDDVGVASAMQALKEWKKAFARMSYNHRDYERLSRVHGEQGLLQNDQQSEREIAQEMFDSIKDTFETEKKEIEDADLKRGLFSNHSIVGEKLDYPKFSGAPSEDYTKFNDKMAKALRHNKIAKSDQVEKLRKYLSGFALNLVPESTETVEKAFATLKAAFGDPKKVLEDKMKKLKLVGDLPGEKLSTGKNGFRKQEEWYLHMEGLLHDIIELGKRDEDLAYEAYSENTFNYILSLFPINMVEKMEDVQGTRKQKLEEVLLKLATFREKARRMGKVYGDKVPPGVVTPSSAGVTPKQADKVSAQPGTFFHPAQEYSDCRVCTQLQIDGSSLKLFENHLSTYPTGCPGFMAMRMVQRKSLAIKVKICIWCLDPEVIYDQSHRDNCRVKEAKIKRFTCEVRNCNTHMWLCTEHKKQNDFQIKKHKDDLKKKGFDMAFANWCVRADQPQQILDADGANKAVTSSDGI